MNVADIMSRDVEFAGSTDTIQAVAELMGEIDVGALPIGSADKLEGIITDRDILFRIVARGLDPARVSVRDVMSRPVITCREDDGLQAAMDLMAANHLRRLPVQNTAGAVTGWITLADVARRMLVQDAALQAALRTLTEAA